MKASADDLIALAELIRLLDNWSGEEAKYWIPEVKVVLGSESAPVATLKYEDVGYWVTELH